MKHLSHSISETFEIASQFAQQLKGGELIVLQGDLGAGKTHFVKGLVEAFEIHKDAVTSPTFSLIQEYQGIKNIIHLDLYRLEHFSQLQELALEDYLQPENIVIIEWPDLFMSHLKWNYKIEIKKIDSECRNIEICASEAMSCHPERSEGSPA